MIEDFIQFQLNKRTLNNTSENNNNVNSNITKKTKHNDIIKPNIVLYQDSSWQACQVIGNRYYKKWSVLLGRIDTRLISNFDATIFTFEESYDEPVIYKVFSYEDIEGEDYIKQVTYDILISFSEGSYTVQPRVKLYVHTKNHMIGLKTENYKLIDHTSIVGG